MPGLLETQAAICLLLKQPSEEEAIDNLTDASLLLVELEVNLRNLKISGFPATFTARTMIR